jgi:hypothetical protein
VIPVYPSATSAEGACVAFWILKALRCSRHRSLRKTASSRIPDTSCNAKVQAIRPVSLLLAESMGGRRCAIRLESNKSYKHTNTICYRWSAAVPPQAAQV